MAEKGELDEAIKAHRAAIRLNPHYYLAHYNLGNGLAAKGDFDGSAAALREAIRLKPDLQWAHGNLGNALKAKGELDEAVSAFREELRLYPDNAKAHFNLGFALRDKAQFAESLDEIRKGHELGTKRADWREPSGQWVEEAQRFLALDARLQKILAGEDAPNGASEQLLLASICTTRKLLLSATRFYEEAFAADPSLLDPSRTPHRYNAACAAVLAASGEGHDDTQPDEPTKERLRGKALTWLEADLEVWKNLLEQENPGLRAYVGMRLGHWRQDKDLESIRNPAPLAKLPNAERKSFDELWNGVDAAIERARHASP